MPRPDAGGGWTRQPHLSSSSSKGGNRGSPTQTLTLTLTPTITLTPTTTLALTVARTLTLAEAAHAARGAEIKAAEEAEPSKGPEERQWNCTACTFENNAFDVLCVMCETPRHSDQWTCPKCSFRNPCTETECIVCGPSGGNAQAVSRAVTRSDIAIANRKAEASTDQTLVVDGLVSRISAAAAAKAATEAALPKP